MRKSRFNSITNSFLGELKKLIRLGNLCTICINDKSEFIRMMEYLGFSLQEVRQKDGSIDKYFVQSDGFDIYRIYVNFDKCFNVDGSLSELTKKTCSSDMLWQTSCESQGCGID
jgi:hypothetical protein